MSFNKDIVKDTLQQISDAICQIEDWNEGIHSSEDYGCSAEGMKTLAATCMLLEAIGEGIKKIDKVTSGSFLRIICPDIPWKDIMGCVTISLMGILALTKILCSVPFEKILMNCKKLLSC